MKKNYKKPEVRSVTIEKTYLLSESDIILDFGGTGDGLVEAPAWTDDEVIEIEVD